jgi:thiopurine S-methyltransferase
MDARYWLERWQSGNTPFDQPQVNADLQQYWPSLRLPPPASVFVPLCGKSVDMAWLRARGHGVIGVELAGSAIAEFYAAQELRPARQVAGRIECLRAAGYELYVGDLFDLEAEHLASVRGVYDRGALIALPAEMRVRYARHLIEILPARCSILLLTLDYPQAQMAGPPFAVGADEVHALYGGEFRITELATREVPSIEPRYFERGLRRRSDSVHLLERG